MPHEPKSGAKVAPLFGLGGKSRSRVETRKGPAFWSKPTPHPRRELPRAPSRPTWGLQDRCPDPPEILGITTWWQVAAVLLVAASLALFSILFTLIFKYTHMAKEVMDVSQQLQRSENRLKSAVQQQAEGRTLRCKSCSRNWMQWGVNCYLHSTDAMSWRDCVSYCKFMNSSLLIGSTEGEMEFLLAQTTDWFMVHNDRIRNGIYWIGLIFDTGEKIWKWANGANLHIRMSGDWQHTSAFVDICVAFGQGYSSIFECSREFRCLCKKLME